MIEVGKAQEGISLENSGPGDAGEGLSDSLSQGLRDLTGPLFL